MDKSPEAFRTISEVAEALETPAHVLRFWESRFPQIKPVKRAGGRRYYRPADVALLGGIRHLLHSEGLTIRGVQKILREQGVRHVAAMSAEGEMAEYDADEDLDLSADEADDAPTDVSSAQIIPLDAAARRTPAPDPSAPDPAATTEESPATPLHDAADEEFGVDAQDDDDTDDLQDDAPDEDSGSELAEADDKPHPLDLFSGSLKPSPKPYGGPREVRPNDPSDGIPPHADLPPVRKQNKPVDEDVPEAGFIWVDDDEHEQEPSDPARLFQDTAADAEEAVVPEVAPSAAPFAAPIAAPIAADTAADGAFPAGPAARLRTLPHPPASDSVLGLQEIQSRMGLLHAQMVEAMRHGR